MMKDNSLVKEEEENTILHNKPTLRLVTGGKDGGNYGENWLRELIEGSVFLARPNNQKDYILANYMLARRSASGLSTNLRMVTPDDRVLDIWVSTLDFSRQNKLHEVVAVVGMQFEEQAQEQEVVQNTEQKKEENNGNGDRTD